MTFDPEDTFWIGEFPYQDPSIIAVSGLAEVRAADRLTLAKGVQNIQPQSVTVAAGKITGVRQSVILIESESGTADDVLSIEFAADALTEAAHLVAFPQQGHDITFKHDNAGGTAGYKLFNNTGADIVLDEDWKRADMFHASTVGGWSVR